MSERVLDSSDEQPTLVLVASLRILRDPVLSLDATNEALAARPAEANDVAALECLGRVVEAAQRDGRIASVERRRHKLSLELVQVGPELHAELHALGASRLARGAEPRALDDDVIQVVARLEREAPPMQALRAIASSGLVVAMPTEVVDRDGD